MPGAINSLPVTSIGDYAFIGSSGLASVAIPESVTNIGNSAFSDCTSLTSVSIPGRVANIGDDAFSGCTSLSSIAIPSSVTSIGSLAFFGCSAINNVAFDNGIRNIGSGAFLDCAGLTSVTLPSSVVTIGSGAFEACTSLINVTIGSRVSYLPWDVFFSCFSLSGVYFEGEAPSADSLAFEYATNATVYYLPGMAGWGPTFDGRPTSLWVLSNPLILKTTPNCGLQSNGFGFTVSWATNSPVVIEGCTDLSNTTLATNSNQQSQRGHVLLQRPAVDELSYAVLQHSVALKGRV